MVSTLQQHFCFGLHIGSFCVREKKRHIYTTVEQRIPFFDKMTVLEHPRFIQQYKSKKSNCILTNIYWHFQIILIFMEKVDTSIIYTIGHSTRSIGEFVQILNFYSIQMLVDIRSFPSSRKVPQYNKDNLASVLLSNNIRYSYLNNLGGRRKVHKDSLNTRWRNASFRGIPIIWKQQNLKQEYMLCKALRKNIQRHLCVLKLFGGAVTALWCLII